MDADPKAVHELIEQRVVCNERLAEHPTCQVAGWENPPKVGILGLLNGLCGTFDDGPKKDWGAIAVYYDEEDNTKIIKFDLIENA
jgi:hypothetical protein